MRVLDRPPVHSTDAPKDARWASEELAILLERHSADSAIGRVLRRTHNELQALANDTPASEVLRPPKPKGRRVALSLPRRWMADLMHICRGMPVFVAARRLHLEELVEARRTLVNPPSWAAIFAQAYSLVAARMPELRRSYQPYPWPHLYEAAESVASVAVARAYEGEPAVFFGLLNAPDRQPLAQLSDHLDDFKTEPVERVRPFARLIKYTRYPKPIRRFLWWLGMNLSGRHRAKTVGTFGMTTLGSRGAGLLAVPSPCATTLTYGPIEADGTVEVRLCCDHRVLDGMTAARALEELEQALQGPIPT